MMAVMRFILYSGLMSLARLCIDRQVKRHAGAIFEQIDRKLPAAMNTGMPRIVEVTIEGAILSATGLPSVDARQVQQVRDLFDPIAFVGRWQK